jgi:hypothetical protein
LDAATLTKVLDVVASTRSTIPAGQGHGAAIMQADIIRHLREAFSPRPGYDPRCCHKTVVQRCPACPYDLD